MQCLRCQAENEADHRYCKTCGILLQPLEVMGDLEQAQLLERQGRMAEAAQEYRRALDLNPQNPAARYGYGLMLYHGGQLIEAVSEFQQAASLNPSFADAHFMLSVCYYRRCMFEESVAAARRVLDIDPTYLPGLYRCGRALCECGSSPTRTSRWNPFVPCALRGTTCFRPRRRRPVNRTPATWTGAFARIA